MKRLSRAGLAVCLVAVAVAFSRSGPNDAGEKPMFQAAAESRNPWSHLRFNNDSGDFQFVVVSDRTGGHRERVFSRAVEQINLLQPEFVLSVGDLIEGYSTDPDRLGKEWREFQGFVNRLQMPFFFVPGNHDLSNPFMEKLWREKFGRRYYHFVYKNVLFLVLNSDDPPGSASLSKDQADYVRQALADNPNVGWTIVALHKPVWTHSDLPKNGWLEVEKALAGRPYTVFAGHVHRYQKFVRQGMNYYQLATTGGGSRMRGVRYGEFDHVVWVTMKKTGPVLANLMLDGIYPENLKVPETVEPVVQLERKPCHPVSGFVYFEGTPAAGATVVFHWKPPDGKKLVRAGDALVESDGSYALSTYTAGDGAPVGEYLVTVVVGRGGYVDEDSDPVANQLPARYAKPETSGLTATVKSGKNELTFELKR